MNEILPQENALSVINDKNVVTFFAEKGLDPIIDKIRKEVKEFKADISSETGRAAIASFAYKIAKMKTQTDDLGKKLVSGIKAQAKIIDAERARAWDEIEKIQHDVRKPLTDWEGKEEARIGGHKFALEQIQSMAIILITTSSNELQERLKMLDGYEESDFEEFTDLIRPALETARSIIVAKIAEIKKSEEDAAELKRLQLAERERQQKERDENIAKEAEERAKKQAEEKASEKIARANREKEESDRRAERAEADRIAAVKKAEQDKLDEAKRTAEREKQQAENAEREKNLAVEAEKQRAAASKKKEEDEAAAREANKKHRAKINNEALKAIDSVLDSSKSNMAKGIVEAIAKGEIPHVKISY